MAEIVSADTRDMATLVQQLKAAQPKAYRAAQAKVRDIGENQIASKARSNASWSKKIPPTIRSNSRGLRTVVTAGTAANPIPVLFERGKPWRHPVFPSPKVPRSEWHWVDMKDPSRPYLAPALDEVGSTAADQIGTVAADAVRQSVGGTG